MPTTKEQQLVIDTLKKPEVSLVLTPAVSGSGKTFVLVELAKQFNVTNGLYFAYNKAIASEAAIKFKDTGIKCMTAHAMALSYVRKVYKLRIGFFNIRDVKGLNSYHSRKKVHETLENFLVSPYTDPNEYLEAIEAPTYVHEMVIEILNDMTTGTIMCSHNFYLKMFHVLLATGSIEIPTYDLILLDEAGDLNPVTLEIFRLLNSPKKIAVGDSKQNIYGFNGTINGFEELANEGVTVPLTKSFRVSTTIAHRIESFVKHHIDKDFIFQGNNYPANAPIKTTMYISRNNSGLLNTMFDLMESGTPFTTTRPINTILELPILLANLDTARPIKDYNYKHIEKLRVDWHNNHSSMDIHEYILQAVGEDDADITQATKVIKKHGVAEIVKLQKYANGHSTTASNIILSTAHSSKGLEADKVILHPDLSHSTSKAILEISKQSISKRPSAKKLEEAKAELLLTYVACSRAKHILEGAEFLGR